MLKELQHQFIKQILGDDKQNMQSRIVEQGELSNEFRISIYTNACRSRFKECIETDHEILGIYLGDDLFDLMVENYIAQYPSQQTSLRYFAEQLPMFLSKTKPFSDHPVIAELAGFERNLLKVFDAPDEVALTRSDLATIAPEQWSAHVFKVHPSIRIFAANYNSVEIWQALKQHINGNQIEIPSVSETPQTWLSWRNQERLTEFKSLNPIEAEVIHYILEEKPFADTCQMLAEFFPPETLEKNILDQLYMLIDNQIISTFNCI